MYPSLEQVKQIASQGDYRRIPVCMEMLSDSYTPVEVMKILRKASRHCYLLESASQSEVWGRYSFLGYDPGMEITCLDDILTIRETMPDGVEQKTIKKIDHPGDVLREILDRYKTPQMEDMPSFTGGLVGYFSYDYIKYSEPKLKPLMKSRVEEGENQDFRDMDMMLFDKVIAFDHFAVLFFGKVRRYLCLQFQRLEDFFFAVPYKIRHFL